MEIVIVFWCKYFNDIDKKNHVKYAYLDCVDLFYERDTNHMQNITQHCNDGLHYKHCCHFAGNPRWFDFYIKNAVLSKYLTIFLTYGWLDSVFTFAELIIFKHIMDKYPDKKIVFVYLKK